MLIDFNETELMWLHQAIAKEVRGFSDEQQTQSPEAYLMVKTLLERLNAAASVYSLEHEIDLRQKLLRREP